MIHLLGQVAHGAQLLLGHAQATVFGVKLSQQSADLVPVVDQIHHAGGSLLAENLSHGVQPLVVVHAAQGVHHGHGVFPLVGILRAGYARQLCDLFLVTHRDAVYRRR